MRESFPLHSYPLILLLQKVAMTSHAQYFQNFIFEDHWLDSVNNYVSKSCLRTKFSWHSCYPRKQQNLLMSKIHTSTIHMTVCI